MEFLYGCFGGWLGTVLWYPIDTIKTKIQDNPRYSLKGDILKNGSRSVLGLYSGMSSPLSGIMLEKAFLFWGYDKLRKQGWSPMMAGLLSGIGTTAIVTPFELVKVKAQTTQSSSWNVVKETARGGLHQFARGWTATWFREVPGYAVYFTVYDYCSSNGYSAPLTGLMSGTSAWLLIYPSDPIKTIMQSRNVGFGSAVSHIYSKWSVGGFYHGFSWGIFRAGLFHMSVITGYEKIKKLYIKYSS